MNIDCYCAVGIDREFNLTEKQLLKAMDTAGVQMAVIAPVDRYLAVDNRIGNNRLLKAAKTHPGRFIAAFSVNPWCAKRSAVELKRCIAAGARILVLHPFIQGYLANDEISFPLLEIVSEENIPVYIHTGPPGNATPWQIVDLAERFPELNFIIGHCGATDFWNDVPGAAKARDNIYLESSLARPFAFHSYLKTVGRAKGIMGSYAPINDFVFEWTEMKKELPEDLWADVLGHNLKRLLERRAAL